MIVHAKGAVWYADASFEERVPLKAAGWWWHGGGCRPDCLACREGLALRRWWTSQEEHAARLAEHGAMGVKESLLSFASRREAALAASRASDASIEIPAPAGMTYRPFQRAGIAYALGREGTLIGDEMGLGKTIMGIGVMNADPSIESVLIVCPATLRMNWWRELRRWDVRPRNTLVPEGKMLPGRYDKIVIVNYEKLVGVNGRRLHARLMDRAWDLLIVDEAHRLKDMKAQRTIAVLGKGKGRKIWSDVEQKMVDDPAVPGLASKARRRIFLTGTPIPNRPEEIFPLLHNLAPAEFPNYWRFTSRYCAAYSNGFGRDASGHSNLAELQDKMRATCMIRRLKKDVLKELPAKIRQVVELDAAAAGGAVAAERDAFAARAEKLAELRADADLAHAAGDEDRYKSAVMALRQGTGAAFTEIAKLRKATAIAKIPQVIEHLDELLEDDQGKVVVMAHHHEVVHQLAAHFGDAAVTLTGETPMADRIGLVRRFQEDADVRVFIGSITAAGVGITLTAASRVVFAELDWVPGNVTQAEDRCHRIGQTACVQIQHLVLSGSLDAQMAQTLIEKQEVADEALDVEHERGLPVVPTAPASAKPKTYPTVSEARRRALHEAMIHLATVCDGASSLDGSGFSRYDVTVGHTLAGAGRLTDGQAWLAGRLATKYRRQLSAFPMAIENVTEATTPATA